MGGGENQNPGAATVKGTGHVNYDLTRSYLDSPRPPVLGGSRDPPRRPAGDPTGRDRRTHARGKPASQTGPGPGLVRRDRIRRRGPPLLRYIYIYIYPPPFGDRSRGGLSLDGKFTHPRRPQERRACIPDRIRVFRLFEPPALAALLVISAGPLNGVNLLYGMNLPS